MPNNPLFPSSADNGHLAGPAKPQPAAHDEPIKLPIAPAPQTADKPAYDSYSSNDKPRDASEEPVKNDDANPAADMIRQKIERLYADEPSAKSEIQEVASSDPPRSKHQQFMYELSNSGKGLAQIQTEWHAYYQQLPDSEKHAVWQEFYDNSSRLHNNSAASSNEGKQEDDGNSGTPSAKTANIYPEATAFEAPKPRSNPLHSLAKPEAEPAEPVVVHNPQPADTAVAGKQSKPAEIRKQLLDTVSSRGKLTARHHVQSLLFGLGFGALVLLIVLFSFFNEVVIAPFIQPSRKVSATPIIVSADGTPSSKQDEVIIPKINLEIPLDFSVTSTSEAEVETALENGVVHYPTTVKPGQKGNTAFFGHSSNNIFNPGKYKFAFVLLHELVPGDTFYLTHGGVTYAYQVYDKKIVKPSDVSVLNPVAGKTATATLITCDPPGTSINRLVVWGEQVSPDPSSNTTASATPTTSGAQQKLPGNGPTLWRRLINAITGN